MRGTFITLEGADGCGKSTQVALLADAIQMAGREVVRLREPGGTSISEKIRALVLDPDNAEMAPECELLLFEATRGLDARVISQANALGSCGVTPDLTLVLDMDTEDALARATRGGADRLEAEGVAFQERVRQGYLDLAAAEPGRVHVVDATGSAEEVLGRLVDEAAPLVDGLLDGRGEA